MRVGQDVAATLLDALRREGLDSVQGAFAYAGGKELAKANLGHRRRTQLCLTDETGHAHGLYLKRYNREGFPLRLRRWWTYGLRTSPADVEFDNIQAVRTAGVGTMQAVICGRQWGRYDAERSYIIVTAVPGRRLLERLAEPPGEAGSPETMRAVTLELTQMVRKFHAAGYVHRDLYATHIFLDEPAGGGRKFYLIDLARVFVPKRRRLRWQVKDLAQLKYSLRHTAWVEDYWDLFLREYLGRDGQPALRRWSRRIDWKVAQMRFRHRRKHRRQKGQSSGR